jgi:hypothetical protein
MTNDLTFISMFLLGLLGSGHCLGMCGPLIVALPGRIGGWPAHLAYHFGRLLTYALIGALLGGAGAGFATAASSAIDPAMDGILRLQLLMSALAALFLLLFGLNRLGILPEPAWLAAADFQKIPILGRLVRRSMQTTQLLSVFTLGLMLGLLPCGLSYAAFARALASGSSLSGGLLVLCFGIGTLPGLLLLGTSAGLLLKRHRRLTEILAGLIMVAMALLLARDISTTLF